MRTHIDPNLPVVAVYNNLETFYNFLRRANDPAVLEQRRYHGDRGIFWLGSEKLLFASTAIPQVENICRRWGYTGTRVLSPERPTYYLSQDIAREEELLQQIVRYAGSKRTIQLIPYATTRQFLELAEILCQRCGLTVLLPESPSNEQIWLRDYIDTKTGFHDLVSHWLVEEPLKHEVSLPFRIVCRNTEITAAAVHWFNRNGRSCVIKMDGGESGLGHMIMKASQNGRSNATILHELQQNPFAHDDLILVEEYIHSSEQLSPSLEFFVPPHGQGEPYATYLSNQIFRNFGNFAGALISRELSQASWYPALAESGQCIANHLQKMGYVGHFDLDTIVDDHENLYLLEVNARRTGGTYVHEFARHTFGEDYLDRTALLSSKIPAGKVQSAEELFDSLTDLLYPMAGQNYGVVITTTSALKIQEFGCILIAPTLQETLELKEMLLARLYPHQERLQEQGQ